jgi:hypothetical protein
LLIAPGAPLSFIEPGAVDASLFEPAPELEPALPEPACPLVLLPWLDDELDIEGLVPQPSGVAKMRVASESFRR